MALLSLLDGRAVEPVGFGVDDPVWDRAPWLDDLRDVPSNATWPRFMTVPHPRAVGTYGPDLVANTLVTPDLRWFQRLWSYRILEHDSDGHLVWVAWLLSVARQLGKSWGATELMLWRVRQGDRFGGAQDCLHVADRLRTAKEVQRRARSWAKRDASTWKVRESNESIEIEYLHDGSRWILRAGDAVYSFSGSLAFVDEAWKIAAALVEEGLVPTLVERQDSQLGLTSTAHRKATSLMTGRRVAALSDLGTGDGDLILEWSCPRSLGIGDVAGWRMASPSWTPARERMIAGALKRALDGERPDDPDEADPIEAFRAQWLNQWPLPRDERDELDPKLDQDAWRRVAVHRPPSLQEGEVVLAFAAHGDYTAIAVAAGTLQQAYVECIEFRSGAGWLPDRMVELVQRWAPSAVGYDAGSMADSDLMTEVRERFAVNGVSADLLRPLTSSAYRVACGGFERAVREGSVTRPWFPDEKPDALRSAGESAEAKRVGSDGFVWDLAGGAAVPLSPLKAVTVARSLLLDPVDPGAREELEGSLMA